MEKSALIALVVISMGLLVGVGGIIALDIQKELREESNRSLCIEARGVWFLKRCEVDGNFIFVEGMK